MSAAIGDHALLSDCRSAALVTADAVVDWWPSPRFDSSSAFSRLLDPEAGHWSVQPDGAYERAGWRYVPGTLVAETTLRTAEGAVRVTDALVFAPGARGHEIGVDVPHALVRVAEAVEGAVDVRMVCRPRLEYGLAVPEWRRCEGGLATTGGAERLFLRGDGPLEVRGAAVQAARRLAAGERAAWILHRAPGMWGAEPERLDPQAALADTIAAWRSWAELHLGYEGVHAADVHLSGLVIQGLTYQPTGALVAAPTTSLPEVLGGDANFDYRYGWLRDASMTASAMSASACSDEARRYFAWIARAAVTCREEDTVQIVYGVEGERDLSEHALAHLDGHRGARPVRVGNAAWPQKQLDVLGHVLDCAWVVRDDPGALDDAAGRLLRQLADRAARQWREPDSSIWEGREGERHYVVSKLFCWVALDRAVRLAARIGAGGDDTARWGAARDAVRAAILDDGWHAERGAFTGAFGSDHLDAGVLLLPLVGLLDADDPRMDSTIAAVEEELGADGLLRRWTGADDGAFLLASFWLVQCHARAGRLDQAHHVYERAAGAANPLGLLAEECDLRTRAPLGNFPLAISHVGLINAASALTAARDAAGVAA